MKKNLRKTPDHVSKERQRLGLMISTWRSRAQAARTGLHLTDTDKAAVAKKVAFCEAEITKCQKELDQLVRAGRRKFWKGNT